MTKRDKWNKIIEYVTARGFSYEVKALVQGDNLWPRSHYPAMFSKELLIILYGEGPMSPTKDYPNWRYHGHKLLDLAFDQGDTVSYLYDTTIGGKNEHNGSSLLPGDITEDAGNGVS